MWVLVPCSQLLNVLASFSDKFVCEKHLRAIDELCDKHQKSLYVVSFSRYALNTFCEVYQVALSIANLFHHPKLKTPLCICAKSSWGHSNNIKTNVDKKVIKIHCNCLIQRQHTHPHYPLTSRYMSSMCVTGSLWSFSLFPSVLTSLSLDNPYS